MSAISSVTNSVSTQSYIMPKREPTPLLEVRTRTEMNDARNQGKEVATPYLLALTKSDINLIKDVTGVNIDYETGTTTPDTFDKNKVDFINAIADKRNIDAAWTATPKTDDLTSTDLKNLFKQAASMNRPLDNSFLDKALNDFFPSEKKQNENRPGQLMNFYA